METLFFVVSTILSATIGACVALIVVEKLARDKAITRRLQF